MASAILPAIGLGGSLFNAIYGGNKYRRAGETVANTYEGAANDITASTGAGQGMVAKGGNDAISAVGNATDSANNVLSNIYTDQKANLSPYLQAGQTGANALAQFATTTPKFSYTPDDFKADPGGYQFLLDQGKSVINNTAAAHGGAVGGNVLKDLTTFGQNLADTKYGESFGRAQQTYQTNQNSTLANLNALTNLGLNATGQFNSASQNFGNNTSTNLTNAGTFTGNTNLDVSKFLANLGFTGTEAAATDRIAGSQARAGGLLGQANAITGGVNQGVQALTGDSGNGSSGLSNILKALGIGG